MSKPVYGSMQRTVTVPADVREDEAKAGFKNGVLLEVRLKKDKNLPKITYRDKITLIFSLPAYPMTFSTLFTKTSIDG